MVSNIEKDKQRFHDIVKGKVRKNLQDLIKREGFVARKGNDKILIPVPNITLPRFTHGKSEPGEGEADGIGQGKGKIGDKVKPGEEDEEGNGPQAGEEAGEHFVEMTVDELAAMLGEELKLPRIEPKGKRTLLQEFERYHGLRTKGPRGLMRFKPSYKNALKRLISTGDYDPDDPIIEIMPEDMRYRSWTEKDVPESSAVIIYMMDVSGSMGEEQKQIARTISFWTDVWLRAHYKGLESVYITHDSEAREVDEFTFYHTSITGGTKIISAYNLADKIISSRYKPEDWNIYLFQYSDGDNWGENEDEITMLENILLPKSNLLCYAQTTSPYGEGKYLKDLQAYSEVTALKQKLVLAKLDDKEDILPTIKKFLGTGK